MGEFATCTQFIAYTRLRVEAYNHCGADDPLANRLLYSSALFINTAAVITFVQAISFRAGLIQSG